MNLNPGDRLHGFTVRSSEDLPEIDGTAFVLDHEKSGAQLLYLKNDDANKAFSIAFKTPPGDDTGVFHILEHSVLCGSDKFPVKEPFVNLLKSSMQTFLNAMTFPDKTMYPVATTNDQDLLNLADVYLDAVLHPAIYRKRAIFEQEGWHYELAPAEEAGLCEGDGADEATAAPGKAGAAAAPGRLSLNGVVYNEMKGALSDPNSVLYEQLQAALFPDTAYRFESGGMPRAIPDLSYERFLEEHGRHYRLDNSYLFLYGNLDLDRMLAFLDESHLSPVAEAQAARDAERAAEGLEALAPRELAEQKPVEALGVVHSMVTAPENACMGLGYVVGTASERRRIVATVILLDALMGSNEAPLKRALLDEGLACDVEAFMDASTLQPFAVIELKGLADGAAERFRPAFERALGDILAQGIDPELLGAALTHDEFVERERAFGIPDGVVLAMTALSGWLYDDGRAVDRLRYEEDFADLRKQIAEGYFNDLARSVFLDNPHRAEVEIRPVADDENRYETERLIAVESSMEQEDFARVAEEEALLRCLQTEADAPEALASLPRLGVSDIAEAPEDPTFALLSDTPLPCLRHSLPTHGIAYAYRYFDLERLSFDELPYAAVLALVLGNLDTAEHSAAQLDTLVNGKLGNLSFFTEIYESPKDPDALVPKFAVSASALAKNAEWLAKLPLEVMLDTDFSDSSKIKDILQQRRIGLEQSFANAGNVHAIARLSSYYLPAGMVRDQLGGVAFYRFLKDLLAHFDERAAHLSERLGALARRLFVDDGCTISFAGPDESLERFWSAGAANGRSGQEPPRPFALPAPSKRNEAFIVPSDVCYAAQGFDGRAFGASYTGAWQVAARALSFDYLWNEVRVKGGAYGAGFQATRTRNLCFYSYRDPHLDETLERFAGACGWLSSFKPSAEEMEGYVVSTVAGFDAPHKARSLMRRQDGNWFAGVTPEERLRTRAEMLACDAPTLQALAAPIERALEQQAACVFGKREIIEASSRDWEKIDLLAE